MEYPFVVTPFKPEKDFHRNIRELDRENRDGIRGQGDGSQGHQGPPPKFKLNPGNWVINGEDSLESAKSIWNFESRKNDVWIVTPPKVHFKSIQKHATFSIV